MQFIYSFYHFVWVVKINSPYIKSSLYMHKTACICVTYVHSYEGLYTCIGVPQYVTVAAGCQRQQYSKLELLHCVQSLIWQQNLQFGSRNFNLVAESSIW